MLAGMIRRPAAISSRINSGDTFSFSATRRISGVIWPWRADSSCVISISSPPLSLWRTRQSLSGGLADLDHGALRFSAGIQDADSCGDPFGRALKRFGLSGIGVSHRNGNSSIAALPDGRIERHPAEQWNIKLLAERLAALPV